MDLRGVGPAGAARVLADVGDVARSRTGNHFAFWTGTAPLGASSDEQIRPAVVRREPAAEPRAAQGRHRPVRLGSEGRTHYLRKHSE